jgi:acetyl-CoA synthetase
MWYATVIGGGVERCPVVDTWWQTETGMILIAPLPGLVATKPGSATRPFPGIAAAIRDEAGAAVAPGSGGGGNLVLTQPWPAMSRTIWGDPERYVATYWSKYPGGIYLTGDGARQDADGDYWLLGRVDDVVNVSGHRLGTMEVESALVSHPAVAEAAVIGVRHPKWDERPLLVVQRKAGATVTREELLAFYQDKVAKWWIPDDVVFVDALPHTATGKLLKTKLRDDFQAHRLPGG